MSFPFKWYEFDQGNPDIENFQYSALRGISTIVIVEAESYHHANYRARDMGISFDVNDEGKHRWVEQQVDWNGFETLQLIEPGPELEDALESTKGYFEAFIHPYKGSFYGAFLDYGDGHPDTGFMYSRDIDDLDMII